MQRSAPTALASLFSATNLKSMLAMLNKWELAVNSASLRVEDFGYSELDDPSFIARDLNIDPLELEEVTSALLARNQASVNWQRIPFTMVAPSNQIGLNR